jgi:carboxyl-terminal processing protease
VRHAISSILCWPAAWVLIVAYGHNASADDPPAQPDLTALAARAEQIVDAVLGHHIEPPAHQQMILDGIRAAYRAAKTTPPADLARRISELNTRDEYASFLSQVWPRAASKDASLDEAFTSGLLANTPGGAHLTSAKEHAVDEQLGANRYVGVHIAIGANDKEKRTAIFEVFEGGPAARAGIKKGDLIEEIDGVDAGGPEVAKVTDRIRGPEGTDVTLRVRQPGSKESRTYRMTRQALPHPTIEGLTKIRPGEWDFRIAGAAMIGYLKFSEIVASTPHELRQIAKRLEAAGIKAVVLDFRHANRSEVHPTVLVADALLDEGIIGRMRTAEGATTYRAEPDALFHGWPMAVLVDQTTRESMEWLAASLQDHKRATIVGAETRGQPYVSSWVAVGDGASWWIQMATGVLERADGRPIGTGTGLSGANPSSRMPAVGGQTQQARGGVVPEVVVAAPEHPRPAAAASSEAHTKASEPARAPEKDRSLEKAVEILRKAIETA